jgi:DNA-binding CsgD family transcriptional regulator
VIEAQLRNREHLLARRALDLVGVGHHGLHDHRRVVLSRVVEKEVSSSEIAELEQNSPRTIRQHVSQIYAQCNVGSRAEFFRLAFTR